MVLQVQIDAHGCPNPSPDRSVAAANRPESNAANGTIQRKFRIDESYAQLMQRLEGGTCRSSGPRQERPYFVENG
jgi:hypothetical protein